MNVLTPREIVAELDKYIIETCIKDKITVE